MLKERVTAFVRGESEESFGELALELFRHRYERDAAFRTLCNERGAAPAPPQRFQAAARRFW